MRDIMRDIIIEFNPSKMTPRDMINTKRQLQNHIREIDYILNDMLDNFTGTVREAIEIGLVKPNFTIIRHR